MCKIAVIRYGNREWKNSIEQKKMKKKKEVIALKRDFPKLILSFYNVTMHFKYGNLSFSAARERACKE